MPGEVGEYLFANKERPSNRVESTLDFEGDTNTPMIEHPPRQQFVLTENDYYCANIQDCGRKIRNKGVPAGWYLVRKSHGPDDPLKTVAIACSVECLLMDASRHILKIMRSKY